jgi:hypothetical protein
MMREIEERARRDRDAEREDRSDLHAAFYGMFLRQQGYSAWYAAKLVVARYPKTRARLQRLIDEGMSAR